MNIAIVILNWNGRQLLETFLPTVIEFSEMATIYVADNASTDDSIAYLQQHYPTVHIIQNNSNGGYAKGYNDALPHIDADIYCLLNSDIAVTKDWLTPVLTAFDQYPNTAAIQPKILDYKQQTHFEYAGAAGGFMDQLGYPYCRGRIFDTLEEDTGQYDDISDIFWASGACFFIRKQVFDTLGGFDEDFFAHQEEIDLCWRIHQQGWDIKYVGHSSVYHVGGATLAAMHPKKTFLNFRNNLLMMLKNLPSHTVVPLIFIRMVLDGIAAIKFLAAGQPALFVAVLKAHGGFYRLFPTFIKKREKPKTRKKYYQISSVVWKYYIRNKKLFNQLSSYIL